jgi:hypothetical protein
VNKVPLCPYQGTRPGGTPWQCVGYPGHGRDHFAAYVDCTCAEAPVVVVQAAVHPEYGVPRGFLGAGRTEDEAVADAERHARAVIGDGCVLLGDAVPA